jgi:hypothetical protein
MPRERAPALDAALPHAASSAAEGRSQAMQCDDYAADAASERSLRQAATAGGAVNLSVGVSHPGGESHGTGSSVRISSPFARASWQDVTHPGSCQPQAPPQQQQQHVHWGAGSVPGTGSASLPPAPAIQQQKPVGSNQQPAGAGSSHDADRRTPNMPAQSLPAAQARALAVTSWTTKLPVCIASLLAAFYVRSLGTPERIYVAGIHVAGFL